MWERGIGSWLRLKALLRRRQLERDLEDELAFHLAQRGDTPEARKRFGNPTVWKEHMRDLWTFSALETLAQDLRYACRILRKSPVFAGVAILSLALGIGANTAIFTVIRAVLLKPLEYRDPDRLVYLSLDSPQNTPLTRDIPFTGLRVEATRAAQSFSGVGAYLRTPENMTLAGNGDPEALKGARVSANFLDVLGIRPAVGRSFRPEEEKPGAPAVAMISAELWTRRFGGDPQVSGKTTTIDAIPYTIIGVLPDGFTFPLSGVDIWVTKPTEWSLVPSRAWTFVTTQITFARLKRGVSLKQARAEMDVINRQYILAQPERGDAKPGTTVRVEWLKDRIVSNVRLMLWVLFGAVGFVLLIACANLASLVLARASSRSREFAVRAALGAGRARLMGQLLSESLVLSLTGGVLGVLLAKWSLAGLPKIAVMPLPRVGEIQVDGIVLGFTVVLSVLTGVLFGSFPSIEVSRPDLADALRESGAAAGRASTGRGYLGVSPRGLLVVSQIALSIVLLIGAVLLMQSFARLRSVDPGFQPTNLLTMKIPLSPARYNTKQKRATFYEELDRRIQSLPGVQGAAIVKSIPTTPWFWTNVAVEGQLEMEAREQPSAQHQSVTPGYFQTMRIPIRRGREFSERDNAPGAPPVFLINETFARRFWPAYPAGLNPVGQHMGESYDKIMSGEIVGIVGDILEGGLGGKPNPEFYVPLAVHASQSAYLVVRTATDPARMANAIRNEVLSVDRDQPVSDITTMEEVFDATLGQRRLTMWLLGGFAGMALLLAVVGIYGVIAYSVAQRTQEVGIRRALGAEQRDILRLILRQALGLTSAGVAIGLAGALAITRVMKTLLFQVSTTDPVAFAGTALLFILVALAASFVPAWRAARIDPMKALRVG